MGGRLPGYVVHLVGLTVKFQLVGVFLVDPRHWADTVGWKKLVLVQHVRQQTFELLSAGDGQKMHALQNLDLKQTTF